MAKVECELITQDAIDVEISGRGTLLQDKSVDVEYNGTIVVKADDVFDGLKSVEINTNVPKRFECGDAVFDTNAYNGNYLYRKITKVDVSCLVTSKTKDTNHLFSGLYKITEIVGLESFDTSNVTRMDNMFNECMSLQSLDLRNFDTSKVINMKYMLGVCTSLQYLDISGWYTPNVNDVDLIFVHNSKLRTIIGDKTLQDVEDGTMAFRGLKAKISTSYSKMLRFSSILALANGLADLTGATAKTLTISANSYNYMYNDDDTTPTADVIAERQARIAAICAAKNWNFAH